MDEIEGPVEKRRRRGRSRREFIADAATAGVGIAVGSAMAVSTEAADAQEPRLASIAGRRQSGAEDLHFTLNINEKDVPFSAEPRVTLLDALRESAGLTGAKKGCDHGQCGACTVLIDGRRVVSCLTLAVMHEGQKITTIEGLASGGELHPVQAAFVKHDGFQCGFCTPGQIVSVVGLMNEGHAASEDDIRELMSGNVCRCGAYPNIVAAIREAIGSREGRKNASL